MEERGLAKGNRSGQNALRTQGRAGVQSALGRIREAAQRDGTQQFTALYHHVYNVNMLRESYFTLRHKAAAGVDGVTWQQYGEKLEENLENLSERLKRGAYRAQPSKRSYVPKIDGRKRPIGVSALEDKIVQRATVSVLDAVYEFDFLGFSYGFRPGRNPHNALDAFYVLDLWAQQWRKRHAQGDIIIVRMADDFVVGCQYLSEAREFVAALKERFDRFGLDLQQEKTRLIEFGRFAYQNRARRGEGKPEKFNFLGLPISVE